MTDGQSANQAATLQQATELHNLGVNVLAVGVGGGVNQKELDGIASSAQNVYTVSNFNALSTVEAALQKTVCAATTPPATTPPATTPSPGKWHHHSSNIKETTNEKLSMIAQTYIFTYM